MRKVLPGLVPLIAAIVAGWLIMLDRQGRLVWDHWDEVKRGILYRSGQLTADQLAQAVNGRLHRSDRGAELRPLLGPEPGLGQETGRGHVAQDQVVLLDGGARA